MPGATTERVLSEPQFAALVDALAADPERRKELVGLLREDHPHYRQRGAATIVRMRGWVLLAIARGEVAMRYDPGQREVIGEPTGSGARRSGD